MAKRAIFQVPISRDADKAYECLEVELRPHGPICCHRGNADPDKIVKVQGKKQSHRPGLYFSVSWRDLFAAFNSECGFGGMRSSVTIRRLFLR